MVLFSTFLTIMGFIGSVHAADFELKDSRILGLYKLVKADKKSDIQKAELIYNADNKLVVITDEDLEYELSGPKGSGVIYDGNDEPNCGGEEKKCWYDSHTEIKLIKAIVDGQEIPQLQIQITKSNAWDEQGTDDYTTTYVLNWDKTLDYAIPYYVNDLSPTDLENIVESCKRELKNIEFEDGAHYLGENDVCPYPHSVRLREPMNKALAYLFKDLSRGRKKPEIQKVTAEQLKKNVFNKARRLAERYKPARSGSATREDILAQIDKIEAYASRGDEIYTYPFLRDTEMLVLDLKTKIVSRFNIRTELNYKD